MRLRTALALVATVAPTVGGGALVTSFARARGPSGPVDVTRYGPPPHAAQGRLRVATWNVAHGRGPTGTQFLTRRAQHRAHLDRIAAVLVDIDADVVAVQEADGPSWSSGGFDHRDHVAHGAGQAVAVKGHHAVGLGMQYGTSLLSRVPLQDALSHPFAPSTPTPPKGFVVSTVRLDGRPLDVVSVHLDFARSRARARQVDELVAVLAQRGHPVVLMGDLNMGVDAAPMRALVTALDLHSAAPTSPPPTFPPHGTTIDYVWASPELAMDAWEVRAMDHSDHRPVVAEVRWRTP